MATKVEPSIQAHLDILAGAAGEVARTWRPNDPEYHAGIYRQLMMSMSFGYFIYFHADAEHPDWAPLWNPVYTLQPNPDDIYLYSPLRGDLRYRISGSRGTIKMITFSIARGLVGTNDTMVTGVDYNDCDDSDLVIGADGNFELLLSTEQPAGHSGNWLYMAPGVDHIMIRYRSYDWANERDPQLTIECLDPVPLKPRLTPAEIETRMRELAAYPGRVTKYFLVMQNEIKDRVGINNFEHTKYDSGLSKQIYWPAVYELEDGEALILETELPAVRTYWNIQINDPYFNAVEFVYRLSSINGATAKLSSDGKLRAVVSLEDPGVPNWLDTAGFRQGTIYGRWYECDSHPMATLKRVKLSEVRDHLPADTPVVTPAERAEELAARVRAAQRRRRW
jgi:hypothetical protein